MANAKLRTIQKKLNDFCKQTGLDKDYSRTTISKKNEIYSNIKKLNRPKKYNLTEQQYYDDKNGTRYHVDGKYVLLEPTAREKEVANMLGEYYGGQVAIIPRVNKPANIKTPDYIINGERFDLKQITGSGKYVIEGDIKKKKEQANNFVIDITKSKIEMEEVERQVKSIYASKRYLWVDKIIIVKENKILKIYKRK